MTDEKKHKNKHFNFKFCFVLVLVVYMTVAIIGQQSKINSLNSEIAQTTSLIEDKKQQAEAIDDEIQMNSSNAFVERIARERLGFVRSDEIVFVDITGK